MKGVVVTTKKDVSIQEFDRPLYKTVGKTVGGYIEHVKPMGLNGPYCMIVNEEGRLIGLPMNLMGSLLYGTNFHGEPIVGDIVIMKDGYENGEPDIIGLSDSEAEEIAELCKCALKPYKEEMASFSECKRDTT